MDLTLYTFLKGILIGIMVSAPMGPVGVLCIQRTLNKGRISGLITGLGASLSDLGYAILTALGMSIVIDFIEANQLYLQIAGSVVLFFFGIYLFRQDPSKNVKISNRTDKNYGRDFVTSFLITLSNPLILFLFIGLFARFSLFEQASTIWHYLLGFFAIVLGAFLWWFCITYIVSHIRSRFNIRTLKVINRIIGVVVIVMSVVGLTTGVIELLRM